MREPKNEPGVIGFCAWTYDTSPDAPSRLTVRSPIFMLLTEFTGSSGTAIVLCRALDEARVHPDVAHTALLLLKHGCEAQPGSITMKAELMMVMDGLLVSHTGKAPKYFIEEPSEPEQA